MEFYVEAVERFQALYERASHCGIDEPNAMTLATAGDDGRPSARVILLKGADQRGFVFYTNCASRKGEQIAAQPYVALCLFWAPLMEQVRVEGRALPVTDAEADAYWKTRARQSQIGAWASHQSRPSEGIEELEARIADFTNRYADQPVPRPDYWSGYRVKPELIEFWEGGRYRQRIHRRTCYREVGGHWEKDELDP